MKVTYEIENGKKIKVKTYVDGSVFKYDENGNEIYRRDNDDNEEYKEYDSNGHMIHLEDGTGWQLWREYDSKGNMIAEWDNIGRQVWFAEDYEQRRVC